MTFWRLDKETSRLCTCECVGGYLAIIKREDCVTQTRDQPTIHNRNWTYIVVFVKYRKILLLSYSNILYESNSLYILCHFRLICSKGLNFTNGINMLKHEFVYLMTLNLLGHMSWMGFKFVLKRKGPTHFQGEIITK